MLITRALRMNMEKRSIRVRQHQHPRITQIDLDPIDLIGLVLGKPLVQDAHHLAFVLPMAGDARTGHMVARQPGDDIGELHLLERKQFHQFDRGKEPIGNRVERRKDKVPLRIT